LTVGKGEYTIAASNVAAGEEPLIRSLQLALGENCFEMAVPNHWHIGICSQLYKACVVDLVLSDYVSNRWQKAFAA
jgi:hypothetical protein